MENKSSVVRVVVGVALLITASMTLGILLYRALCGLDTTFDEEYEGCDFIG